MKVKTCLFALLNLSHISHEYKIHELNNCAESKKLRLLPSCFFLKQWMGSSCISFKGSVKKDIFLKVHLTPFLQHH